MADINNIVIDRILRGAMLSTNDGSVLWEISQITNPSLTCSTETQDAVDALGIPIVTFERAKTIEFSAENALFDLRLFAAQSGTEKVVASSSNKITVPTFEEIVLGADPAAAITLKHAPIDQIREIHLLNGDSSMGTRFVNGSSATATEFVHTAKATQLTPPTGLVTGNRLMAIYDYESETGVSVVNSANSFPTAGRFIMDVLGCDPCNVSIKKHFYIIMDNGKLTSDWDLSFATDSTHPFTIRANQAYCSAGRELVKIVAVDED